MLLAESNFDVAPRSESGKKKKGEQHKSSVPSHFTDTIIHSVLLFRVLLRQHFNSVTLVQSSAHYHNAWRETMPVR